MSGIKVYVEDEFLTNTPIGQRHRGPAVFYVWYHTSHSATKRIKTFHGPSKKAATEELRRWIDQPHVFLIDPSKTTQRNPGEPR